MKEYPTFQPQDEEIARLIGYKSCVCVPYGQMEHTAHSTLYHVTGERLVYPRYHESWEAVAPVLAWTLAHGGTLTLEDMRDWFATRLRTD